MAKINMDIEMNLDYLDCPPPMGMIFPVGGDKKKQYLMHKKNLGVKKVNLETYYTPLLNAALKIVQEKPKIYTRYEVAERIIYGINTFNGKMSPEERIRRLVWSIGADKRFKGYFKSDKDCSIRKKYLRHAKKRIKNTDEFWNKLLNQALNHVKNYPKKFPSRSLAEYITCLQPPEIRELINLTTFIRKITSNESIRSYLRNGISARSI